MGIDEKTMHPNGCKAKPKTASFLWFRAARTRNSSLRRSVTPAALFSRDELSRHLAFAFNICTDGTLEVANA